MAPETFTEARASATQATRKGWPRKRSLKPVPGHPQGVAPETFTEARASATQATRKGWPYYIRPLHQRHDRFVYSRYRVKSQASKSKCTKNSKREEERPGRRKEASKGDRKS